MIRSKTTHWDYTLPAPLDELPDLADQYINEYCELANLFPVPAITLEIHKTNSDFEAATRRIQSEPIISLRSNRSLKIYFNSAGLEGITYGVLQGWLDRDLGRFFVETQPDYASFNFSKQIIPLFRVSGSGVNILRYMTECLIRALKDFRATRMALEIGHGEQQTYFYFYYLHVRPEDIETYKMITDYAWTRAIFICKRFAEYAPLAALIDRRISFSSHIEEQWWRERSDMLQEDQDLIRSLAGLLLNSEQEPFPDKIAEIFTSVKNRLLRVERG